MASRSLTRLICTCKKFPVSKLSFSQSLHHCLLPRVSSAIIPSISSSHIHTAIPRQQSDRKQLIISKIVQNVTETPLDSLLYKKTTFEKLIESMFDMGFTDDAVSDLFTSTPVLLGHQSSVLDLTFDILLQSGFTPEGISSILKAVPEIVECPDNIGSVIEQMYRFGFTETNTRKMVVAYPGILSESASDLSRRYTVLMEFFRKSDIQHMLRVDPSILFQSKREISAKVNYIYHRMGLDQVEMTWANLLCHDIEHIRARHLFLERAGKYEKPDNRGSTRAGLNPYLKDMLGSSNAHFAKKLAGLSREEYEVFKKIVPLELSLQQKEFDERFDSDDEGDVEDGEEKGYKAEKVQKRRMRQQLLEYD